MFRIALMARLIDEAAFRQNRMGRAPFVVPVSGHEGCQIGTAWAMRRGTDIWLPYYRDLAVVLVAGMTPYEVFLGIFSKADDPSSGGRQMPAHWGSRRLGIITGSSPIATQVPHAAGIAYAVKYRQEDAVVATWFGDGATSEGDWHEGLNFAGVHKLPVIFVCENNHYAISVPQSKQMAIQDVAQRAAGYGFPGVVVDGNDVLACYGAMKQAHDRARAGEGPTLIECKTYRFQPHTSDDDDRNYRSREEVQEARDHDPLVEFGTYLVGTRHLGRGRRRRRSARRSRPRSTATSPPRGRPPTPIPRRRSSTCSPRTHDREERRHRHPRRAARRDRGGRARSSCSERTSAPGAGSSGSPTAG